MKKTLFAAAVALFVCAAQAVTVTWKTTDEPSALLPTDKPSTVTHIGAGPVSVVALVDITPNTSTEKDQLLLKVVDKNDGFLELYNYKNENGLGASVATYPHWTVNNPDQKEGTFLVSMIFNAPVEGALGENVRIYINGTELAWNSYDTGAKPLTGDLTLDVRNTTAVKEVAAYSWALTPAQMEKMRQDGTANLPEPSTLALLALGIAGIALRRRAA